MVATESCSSPSRYIAYPLGTKYSSGKALDSLRIDGSRPICWVTAQCVREMGLEVRNRQWVLGDVVLPLYLSLGKT